MGFFAETQNQIILGCALALFLIVVGGLTYLGKIRPQLIQAKQMKVLKERKEIEYSKLESAKGRNKNKKGKKLAPIPRD